MGQLDLTKSTTIDPGKPDFEVEQAGLDEPQDQKESTYMNTEWPNQLGAWEGEKNIPELRGAIKAMSTYVAGLGFTTESTKDQVILEGITGWGEDNFTSIMMNLLNVSMFGRDAYAEIIRNDKTGTLINLMPLNTGRMRHVLNREGRLIRYEYLQSNGKFKSFIPERIFHICNDRIANQMRGTSFTEIAQWITDAKQEAMRDWRRISHLSSIRIMYVDEDDTTRLNKVNAEYAAGIKNGSVMVITGKKDEVGFEDLVLPPVEAFMTWIRYLENYYYQIVGVPRVIATAEDLTEAASKVGTLNFEPFYTHRQHILEADIWNQLGIRIKFNRPPSLSNNLQQDQAKDGPNAFQPNDIQAGVGK